MRVLFENPARAAWRLRRATAPGRPPVFLTGWYGDRRRDPHAHLRGALLVEEVRNVVVEGAIKPRGFSRGRSAATYVFAERDGEAAYETGGWGMLEIAQAVADGRLRVEDGHFVGRFTFAKDGQQVYLRVWDGDGRGAFGAAGDAPDLSEFVSQLPPPGRGR